MTQVYEIVFIFVLTCACVCEVVDFTTQAKEFRNVEGKKPRQKRLSKNISTQPAKRSFPRTGTVYGQLGENSRKPQLELQGNPYDCLGF